MAYDLNYLKEVEAKYKDMWRGFQCRLCGWWVNGRSTDEAIKYLHQHEKSHPEWERYQAALPEMHELHLALHEDHDCNPGPCQCKCGCTVSLGCTVLFGPLCSVCFVQDIRGDNEHGIRRGEQDANPAY